jgi:hypothetical protein
MPSAAVFIPVVRQERTERERADPPLSADFRRWFPGVYIGQTRPGNAMIIGAILWEGEYIFRCLTNDGVVWLTHEQVRENHIIALIDWLENQVEWPHT